MQEVQEQALLIDGYASDGDIRRFTIAFFEEHPVGSARVEEFIHAFHRKFNYKPDLRDATDQEVLILSRFGHTAIYKVLGGVIVSPIVIPPSSLTSSE